MTSRAELQKALTALGLRCASEQLERLIGDNKKIGPEELIERLITLEREDRSRRSLERRNKRSRVGDFKLVCDFDWTFPRTINRGRIQTLLELDFMRSRSNVIFAGQHGTGKTMLAKNIAHNAVLAGHSVLFTSVSRLLNDLAATDSRRQHEARMKRYASVELLVADELGYLAYDNTAADTLFELVSRRHEARKPLIVTTNLAFKDWGTVFPHATCTVALVDRLTHHADIINIDGPSWRRKEAGERDAAAVAA